MGSAKEGETLSSQLCFFGNIWQRHYKLWSRYFKHTGISGLGLLAYFWNANWAQVRAGGCCPALCKKLFLWENFFLVAIFSKNYCLGDDQNKIQSKIKFSVWLGSAAAALRLSAAQAVCRVGPFDRDSRRRDRSHWGSWVMQYSLHGCYIAFKLTML